MSDDRAVGADNSLLPCPFCGSPGAICAWENETGFWVNCSCGVETSESKTEAEARAVWNTRAPPKPAPDAVRSLSDNIQSKLVQLRHYRDHDCQLDHAKTIAEGRIIQLEQVAHWLASEYVAPPVPSPDGPITTEQLDQLQFGRTLHKRSSPDGAGEPDQEQVFIDICNELGCPYDNEAALIAIDLLKDRAKANATPPVRADREAIARTALENARLEMVLAISFLGRDAGSDRLQKTITTLIERFHKADDAIRAALSLDVQPGAGERSDAAEADRYFEMAGEFGHQLQALAGVAQDAIDFLTERKRGNAARSPGHNARVILETALKKVSPSALPVRQPQSTSEGEMPSPQASAEVRS